MLKQENHPNSGLPLPLNGGPVCGVKTSYQFTWALTKRLKHKTSRQNFTWLPISTPLRCSRALLLLG